MFCSWKPECVTSVEVFLQWESQFQLPVLGIAVGSAAISQVQSTHFLIVNLELMMTFLGVLRVPGFAESSVGMIFRDLFITLNYLDFFFSIVVMALSSIPYISKMRSSLLQVVTSDGFLFCFWQCCLLKHSGKSIWHKSSSIKLALFFYLVYISNFLLYSLSRSFQLCAIALFSAIEKLFLYLGSVGVCSKKINRCIVA